MRLNFTLLASVLLFNYGFAQDAAIQPLSQLYINDIPAIEFIDLGGLDMNRVSAEDLEQEDAGGMSNFGRVIERSLHSNSDGLWTTLSDGSKIWRLALSTEGAMGMAVYFNHFELPQGAEMYVYDQEMNWIDGPYTAEQMDSHGKFLTGTINADNIIIEYNQKAEIVGMPEFLIKGAAHFYRYIYDYQDEDNLRGGSEPCEVDVACPEGNNWQEEKDAVVRLQITEGQFVGLCSGVLVNTTARDCRPYLLSALHCANGISNADLAFLQVRFNYARPLCGSGFFPSNRNVTGVNLLADSNDGGGESGSDFVLFEIEDVIPSGWTPFFAGWRASSNTSPSGVSIHHPAGDVKKISTYSSNLQSVWLGAPGSHWQVNWVQTATNHGVTEGGSSGSPIFDNNRKVIGTLTGGNSFCASPNAADYYGKMSYHWLNNPNAANEKLKVWLDPLNTGEMQIEGSYVPCVNSVGVIDRPVPEVKLSIYPNPSNGIVTLSSEQLIKGIDIIDARGALIRTLGTPNQNQIDLSDLPSGVYVLTIHLADGMKQSGRLSIY